MTPPPAATGLIPARLFDAFELLLIAALAGTFAATTLCLGGATAGIMVWASAAVFGLAIAAVVLWRLGRLGEALHLHWGVLLPLPFLAYALASTCWLAPAGWLAWREWLLWFQMWLIFAVVLHFGRGRGGTWILVGVFVGLGLVGIGMAAYQRFADPTWMMLGRTQALQFRGRSAGMFGIPGSLAGLLGLMIPACLCLISTRAAQPAAKVFLGWLALLFFFALVLTGSRGGWISTGIALLLWPLLTKGDWRRKVAGSVIVGVAAVLGIWALYTWSPYARERIQPFLEGKFEITRPIIWKAGVQLWRDQPWLGTGAASYNVRFDEYRPRGFRDEPLWAHNDYLNTLSDYGLVGFALWFGAGAGLLGMGWSAVRAARREASARAAIFLRAKWKLGIWLGLVAYSVHLAVDFHTKIPALAFAAAIAAGLLVRDDPRRLRILPAWTGWLAAAVALLAVAGAWHRAWPLYRAEALRAEARRSIDRFAIRQQGDLPAILAAARREFTRAVRIDPCNGQAWADLAYATVYSVQYNRPAAPSLGRFAELAADRALALCPVNAEFWVRKAAALEVQRGRPETEDCYLRALELAPHSRMPWLAYARFLSQVPGRRDDARRALETCLALDPYFPATDSLRQQLLIGR
jgi:O-antigen ligase